MLQCKEHIKGIDQNLYRPVVPGSATSTVKRDLNVLDTKSRQATQMSRARQALPSKQVTFHPTTRNRNQPYM